MAERKLLKAKEEGEPGMMEKIMIRIDELAAKREKDLRNLQEQIGEAKKERDTLEAAIKAAVKEYDYKAYMKAQKEKEQVEEALGLCEGQYSRLVKTPIMNKESDKRTHEAIWNYKRQIQKEYTAELIRALQEVDRIATEYETALDEISKIYTRAFFNDSDCFSESEMLRSGGSLLIRIKEFKDIVDWINVSERD